MNKESLIKIVNKFKDTKILVIGDVMIDMFIWGKVSRISPEAPVPVVEVTKETFMPGGAGNVVSNIMALGGKAYIAGVIGNDIHGETFLQEMQFRGVDTSCVIELNDRPTIIKTRIVAQHQQVVRVDRESKATIPVSAQNKLIENIKNILSNVDGVVISDYGKGVIFPKLLSTIITEARRKHKPVLVDPKIEHFKRYKKVSCITPNLLEAVTGMNWLRVENQSEVEKLGQKIMKTLDCESLLITQGEKGMTIFEKNKITQIPTMAQEVFDVTGAGDTVISTLSMCLANGSNIRDGAYISNCAAGIVVGKLGTATTTQKEIIAKIKKVYRG